MNAAAGNDVRALWGDGEGNLYMVHKDEVLRNDGNSCQVVASAGDDLYGIYGSPDGQIYAGGEDGTVLYFDGSTWQESTEADDDIRDVWVSSTGTVYYGGEKGEVTICTVPVPNVVGDWPLDDCTLGFDGSAVIDAGPNGLDGVSTGGIVVEPDGQMCSAAGFNGSSSYVSVPDNAALDLAEGVSLAVWIRHNSGSLKNWEAIAAKGDSAYRLHLNGGCAISDSLPGNTRHGITFGLNGGCAGADLNSNVVPSPGVWYHVAATYDRSEMRIYINGNLVNTASYSAAINTNNFALFIGENSQQRNRYWNGDVDELVIWDAAITQAEIDDHMNRTRPCNSCAAAEFTITHDGYGIHCVDETVGIEVVDSLSGTPRLDYDAQVTLDTQTGNGTWTLVSGSGVFADATADDGVATYDWPLGESEATFALSYTQGPAVFDMDVYQTSDPGIRDTDAEGPMTFSASGFSVTAAPLANPPGIVVPFASSQVAAVDFPIYITAYGQTPSDPACGVIETYDGTKDLKTWFDFANPVNGSIAPTVDGVAAATSEAAAVAQAVVFSNGQAAVTGRYKDAGRIQLSFADDNVADPNLPDGIRGATAPFVVKPFAFVLSGIEDANGVPNPAATDATGAAFTAAGRPFAVTVTALDADGDATPNYGRELIPETVMLTANLVSPAGGNNPRITSGTGFGAFAGGQATGNDFAWPETGIITLTPSVGDGDYLGAGNVTGIDSGNVGRFHPDHFTAALNAPMFRTACSAGSFTYLGQPFTYSVPPAITTTARATDGSVTQNYAGAFFRIDNSTLQNRSYTSANGTLDTSGVPGSAGDPAVADLGNGVAALTFDAGAGLVYDRSVPEMPFSADIALSIDVIDADGVTALTNPVTFGAGSGIVFDAGAQMRYGRIRLVNSIGSELVNLNVPMRAEYFAGSAMGFVSNADDSCSADIALSLGAFTDNLAAGETCVIESGAPGSSGAGCAAPGPAGLRYREPPLAGDFNLYLQAPGDGNDGSTTITADVPAWLRFDWNAALPGLENPAGTATFGIYRGEDRRIYTRELY
ncbi:MAG: LamG domain-containing protein [Woeseiaceae bacterium]|nr:LamG domain-containing protein [Woeseiaceae bacterium]